MAVPVKFVDGPLNGLTGLAATLPLAQIFVVQAERKVLWYNRIDELVYQFDPAITDELTRDYDRSEATYAGEEISIVGWETLDKDAPF